MTMLTLSLMMKKTPSLLLVLSVWLRRCWRCRWWWRRHPVCCSVCLYDYDDVDAVADDEEDTQSVASFVCMIMTMLALSLMMKKEPSLLLVLSVWLRRCWPCRWRWRRHPVCCSFCLYDYDDVGAVADDEEAPSLLLVLCESHPFITYQHLRLLITDNNHTSDSPVQRSCEDLTNIRGVCRRLHNAGTTSLFGRNHLSL